MRLVSRDAEGLPAAGSSTTPNIDATGTWVTFVSDAELLPGVTGAHVYRVDL